MLRGTLWVSAAEVASVVVSSLVGLVGARLLEPRDFGLIGTVLVATNLLESATQFGVERALIQRRGDIEPLLDTAWTWQVLRGLILSVLLMAGAPVAAGWYGAPALLELMLVLGLAPLLRGLSNPGVVALARELALERQFVLRVVPTLGGALLTLGALVAFESVWALCVRTLAEALLSTVLSYALVRRRPRFAWDVEHLRQLWSYGRWITMSAFMVLVITRGDDLFVSRYFGLHALGLYQMAYLLTNFPATHVAHVLSRAAFPVFARLQDEPAALRASFVGVLTQVLFISFSVFTLLLLGARDLVDYVLGRHWAEATPLIHILALAGLMRSVAGTGSALFHAVGQPRIETVQNLPRLLFIVLGIWPAAAVFGLQGVCLVVLVALLPAIAIWARAIHRVLGLDAWSVVALAGRPALVAGLLAVALETARYMMPDTPGGTLAAWGCGLMAWLVGVAAADKILGWRTIERIATMLASRGNG